ncbi:MYXO-CTERM sorting domain-containing protein [Paraliomyxa miuraensis]|uniref:MYXO-CTERM sorting domain-containing protein n=1 Tax=Paraliomyxa miuraensis TaxID=376150 RepID=UPI002257C433|nr:MYXO-CTERM sorting domain-containing protein [Paraliomyxa miuraensis]MCX4244714.1 MYXO-CTERM sorting domain-containing protein [Paraliomyxa miuraensis]
MVGWSTRLGLGFALGWVALLVPTSADGGTLECSNARIEPDADCTVQAGDGCSEHCRPEAYVRSCSTHQYQQCRDVCTGPPDPVCTQACIDECDERCAAGVQIVCHDNCFPECTDACTALCDQAEDTIQCRASCEATCDGECDHQCSMLPEDADCITHCIECCGGSCIAAANMECQQSCQSETWLDCETEQHTVCEAACTQQGALFCDGQLVAAGDDVTDCAEALSGRGMDVALDPTHGQVHAYDPRRGCACRSEPGEGLPEGLAGGVLAILGLLGLRRRRRGPAPTR